MPSYIQLTPGDPAPWFKQRSFANPRFTFDIVAGRYLVLCFYASAGDAHAQAAIQAVRSRPELFDDTLASFFGVSLDAHDESEHRVANHVPGYRYFWDFDGTISRLYGALPREAYAAPGKEAVYRMWVVLDPTLRVLRVIPFRADQGDIGEVLAYLDSLAPAARFAGFDLQAPVMVLPNVFEPEFCRTLIGLYETHGGTDSGFMRDLGGQTHLMHDPVHKRRKDCVIEDAGVIQQIQTRFTRRVVPEILKAYQFKVAYMERYIVSCYASEDAAHFRPHRDNTTQATAHRRFAVSVNLNEDFDGGEVSFPEYGPRSFKAPAGGAVVFSCSLLHAVSTVTRGRRFAFLPFLYDEAAAQVLEANANCLARDDGNETEYR